MILEKLPPWTYRTAISWFDKLREFFFSKPVDDQSIDIVTEVSVEEVRDALGDAYFTNAWELSWHYRGEDMNMRRPLRKDDKYEWYQTHVRAWSSNEGAKLSIHEDLEPTEHPYYHLNPPEDADLDADEAAETVSKILSEAGIPHRIVE